jgi:hypothetical protein
MHIVLDHEDAFGLFHPAQSFGAMGALPLGQGAKTVGASLLAMAQCQSTTMLTVPSSSRASSLPQEMHCSKSALCIVRVFRGLSYHELFNFP